MKSESFGLTYSYKLVWIADLMPDEVANIVGDMIQQGQKTMKATLEF
jgi:hypothetical protein